MDPVPRPNAAPAEPFTASIARFGLYLVVAVAPLFFGGNRDWIWTPLAVLTALSLAALAVAQLSRAWPARPGPWPVPVALMAVVCLWCLVQTIPWPGGGGLANPLYEAAGRGLGTGVAARVSIDAELTFVALLRLLTYVGVFWLAVWCCRSERDARRLVTVVVAAATIYSLYGLLNHLHNGTLYVLWERFRDPRDYLRLSATFPNANHFATYGGLALVAALALFAEPLRRAVASREGGLEKIRAAIPAAMEARQLVLATAIVVLGTAVALTNSRAGLAAVLAGLFCVFAGYVFAGARPLVRGFFALAGLAAAVWLVATVSQTTFLQDRVADVANNPDLLRHQLDARTRLYQAALEALATRPLAGWGLGTFVWVFPLVQPEGYGLMQDHAHNTPLEAAIDLGLPAAAALLLAILATLVVVVQAAGTTPDRRKFRWLALAASVLVGLHSLFDFSLQIPGIAITWAALLGACASGWHRIDRDAHERESAVGRRRLRRPTSGEPA